MMTILLNQIIMMGLHTSIIIFIITMENLALKIMMKTTRYKFDLCTRGIYSKFLTSSNLWHQKYRPNMHYCLIQIISKNSLSLSSTLLLPTTISRNWIISHQMQMVPTKKTHSIWISIRWNQMLTMVNWKLWKVIFYL